MLRVTVWLIRWIKIIMKKVNRKNINEGNPTQLHVFLVEELIAAEVVFIKGY